MKVSQYNFLAVLLSFLSVIGFNSCDDDECFEVTNPLCENYDPCYEVTEVKAAFEMYQPIMDTLVEKGDTLTGSQSVLFEALEDYDSYEWHIGEDPRVFTDKAVSLYFPDTGSIEIMLIVTKAPNTDCFPNDDGRDTITRTLRLMHTTQSLITGDYEGYLISNPDHIFTVNIFTIPTTSITIGFVMNNFNEGCEETNDVNLGPLGGYYSLGFNGDGWIGNGCNQPVGSAVLQPNRKDIVIQGRFEDPGPAGREDYYYDTFIGTKK